MTKSRIKQKNNILIFFLLFPVFVFVFLFLAMTKTELTRTLTKTIQYKLFDKFLICEVIYRTDTGKKQLKFIRIPFKKVIEINYESTDKQIMILSADSVEDFNSNYWKENSSVFETTVDNNETVIKKYPYTPADAK